jgi:hypothetical protein
MNFGRGWVFLVPLLVFVITAMVLSCGGGGGSASATPGPPGPSILSISICEGAAPLPTPFPTTVAGQTPSATPTETPCADFFTETSIPENCTLQLHAVALLNNGTTATNGSTIDVTNSSSSNWTSDNTTQLLPITIQGNQGLFKGVELGTTTDVVISIPGLSSPPVAVTVASPQPTCPALILIPPTPAVTPSP